MVGRNFAGDLHQRPRRVLRLRYVTVIVRSQ
jgi:hypothetical protein